MEAGSKIRTDPESGEKGAATFQFLVKNDQAGTMCFIGAHEGHSSPQVDVPRRYMAM